MNAIHKMLYLNWWKKLLKGPNGRHWHQPPFSAPGLPVICCFSYGMSYCNYFPKKAFQKYWERRFLDWVHSPYSKQKMSNGMLLWSQKIFHFWYGIETLLLCSKLIGAFPWLHWRTLWFSSSRFVYSWLYSKLQGLTFSINPESAFCGLNTVTLTQWIKREMSCILENYFVVFVAIFQSATEFLGPSSVFISIYRCYTCYMMFPEHWNLLRCKNTLRLWFSVLLCQLVLSHAYSIWHCKQNCFMTCIFGGNNE